MPNSIQSLNINPSLGLPVYRQVMEGIQNMVAAGVLKAGDRLPSVRDLASQLRINPSSVVKVYKSLQRTGLITLDQGRGTFISGQTKAHDLGKRSLLAQEIEKVVAKGRQYGLSDQEIKQMVAATLDLPRSTREKR
jgi:GntR family transcriptional regulator